MSAGYTFGRNYFFFGEEQATELSLRIKPVYIKTFPFTTKLHTVSFSACKVRSARTASGAETRAAGRRRDACAAEWVGRRSPRPHAARCATCEASGGTLEQSGGPTRASSAPPGLVEARRRALACRRRSRLRLLGCCVARILLRCSPFSEAAPPLPTAAEAARVQREAAEQKDGGRHAAVVANSRGESGRTPHAGRVFA